MKPLTPRIRIRFMTTECASCLLYFEEAQDFTIAAGREPLSALPIGTELLQRMSLIGERRLENPQAVGERPGKGRRDRPHQVVDLARALRPVDAPVLGLAPAVVAAGGEILRRQLCFSRDEIPD